MLPIAQFRPRFVALLLFVCAAFSAHNSYAQTAAPTQTPQVVSEPARRPLPPRQYIPAHDYDTRHIKLDLRFDWTKEQAIGTATITFAPLLADTRTVEFDARNMTINQVKLASGATLNFTQPPNKLKITLDRAYQPSEQVTVQIAYNTNGTIEARGILGFGQGLTFIKPTAEQPNRPMQIWSQGETEYNSTWFPCHDHPNDFATSELTATVEGKYYVISNGKLLENKQNADGTRTFHWMMEKPHASYLASLVVGEYTPIEANYAGIPITTYVYPNEATEGKVTAGRIANMVQFFSERTGVKYPYDKYAQTFVRDFGGGMENISATTLTDQSVIDARTGLDETSDSLLSHELAHQWFGDYVTTRTWAHIWLNESFATYFQALWREKDLGADEFLYADVRGNQEAYFQAWAQGQRRPIVTDNYADANNLFDTYAYPRGGAVLHMLRRTLGDEAFFRSINRYLTKNANQPVVTEQFRQAIEDATGQPMDWFFEQWVYKMGHPVFNVTKTYDATKKQLTLTVRQEQKPDPSSGYPQADFFRVPLDVEIVTQGKGSRVERVTVLPQAEQTFVFDNVETEPLSVDFDNGGNIIKELKYDKPLAELLYQIGRDKDVLDRTSALKDLTARATPTGTSEAERTQIVAAMVQMLRTDKYYGARLQAARALAGIPNAVTTPAVREALLAATKDERSLVRAEALRSLARTKDASLASTYRAALGDQSYSVIRAAASAYGATKDKAAFDELAKLVQTESFRNRVRVAGLGGLAALEDPRALDIALRYAAKGNESPTRGAALGLLGAVGKNDPRSYPLIAEAFTYALEKSDFQLGQPASQALVALADPRGLQLFRDARAKTTNPQITQLLYFLEQSLQKAIEAKGKPPAGAGRD